ncbi:MAG: hypothetical protein JWO37_2603 [Acidimicrobiales bacterium]|nr:hypothetical protein [Acidimicrobiales bacterium]
MEIRIGVIYTAKEIEVDLGEEADRDKVIADIETAVASDDKVLWLTDKKGRRVGVPAAKIAYLEIDVAADGRRVGFSAI